MHYTIGEAAKRVGLTAHTLRYYDKEGLLPFVERGSGGARAFKEKDFGWIRLINCLKASGISIKGIRQYIDWYQQGDSTLEQRRDLFQARKIAVQMEIANLQTTLDTLNYKCWTYEKAVELGSLEAVHAIPVELIPSVVVEARARMVEG